MTAHLRRANETSTRRQDKPGLDMLNAVLKDQILRATGPGNAAQGIEMLEQA